MEEKKYLVTGTAGFIGSFLAKKLLEKGFKVIGIDNLNSYYDKNLKLSRLEKLLDNVNFIFEKVDISEKKQLDDIFKVHNPNYVINLAAQAGVRYSIENPDVYIESNIIGFFNILEMCRKYPVDHLLFASSSSVYGSNTKIPFEESDTVDHPVSLYAASKKSNELMAYAYSKLYDIPTSGLRFFTVYGPYGRPDMAYFSFIDSFFAGNSIKIYNGGNMSNDMHRDFTYIDDIVDGILLIINKPPNEIVPHYRILNIGNGKPEKLMFFVSTLEKCLSNSLGRNIVFKKVFEEMKPGDVMSTYASTLALESLTGFKPKTSIQLGLQKFTDWYVDFYGKK